MVDITADEIYLEFSKCLLDPTYPIETYFKTFDKTRAGFVPFKLFDKQKEVVSAYKKHRLNLVTKPRQAGISVVTAAHIAVEVGFADKNNPEAVLIVANKQEMAFEFLSKIKDFLLQLPRWVWGSDYYGTPEKEKLTIFDAASKKEIRLPNGCRIKAVATSKDALRGYTPTYLVIDEAAFIEDGKKLFGAAFTALGTGGRCILISTPNGHDEIYYETYDKAIKKENDFNIIEMRWYQDNRYNRDLKWIKKAVNGMEQSQSVELDFTLESYAAMIKSGYRPTSPWYEEMCRGMNNDARMIAQELDVSFLGSGGNVIDEKYIEYHRIVNVVNPKFVDGNGGEIWVWDEPIVGHEYIIGSDVSRGDGEDYSTFVVIDVTTMEEVVEFQGKLPPDKLADLLFKYGTLYSAMIVVDATGGYGEATIIKLQNMKYPNLYKEVRGGSRLPKSKDVGKDNSKLMRVGFQVGSDRTRVVAQFEKMVRLGYEEGAGHGLVIKSIRLISELNTFVYRNGRADHQDGKHDDIIMAVAIALYVLEYSFKDLKALKSKTKKMLASWMTSSDVSLNKSADTPQDRKDILKNLPKGTYENAWLFI